MVSSGMNAHHALSSLAVCGSSPILSTASIALLPALRVWLDGLDSRDETVMPLVEGVQWHSQCYSRLPDQHIEQASIVAQVMSHEHLQRLLTVQG